jgi:hypothetical protein
VISTAATNANIRMEFIVCSWQMGMNVDVRSKLVPEQYGNISLSKRDIPGVIRCFMPIPATHEQRGKKRRAITLTVPQVLARHAKPA